MTRSRRHHRPTALALAAACAVAALPAAAQTAAADKAANQQLDTIVVTGIRASQERSLATKRQADGIVEVVSAEDIGKMPDKNVADALQRLPGVMTTAGSGGQGGYDENDRVSLRGTNPSLALTTINGHSVATADWDPSDQIAGGSGSNSSGAARSVSFLLLPSEIVGQVIVRKSASADQVEGGVSGSVDILTRRALDFKKRFGIEAGAQAVYSDQARKTDPQLNALLNWKNDGDTVGVLLQLFDQTRHIRREGQSGITWSPISASTPAGQANGGALAGKYFVSGAINALFEQERRRRGGVLAVDAKLTPGLRVNVEGFRSTLDASYTNSRLYIRPSNSVAASGGVVPTDVQLDGNRIVAARFNNSGNAMGAQLETQVNPLSASRTQYLNADATWQASESLQFKAQGGTTRAQGDSYLYWNYAFMPNTATAYRVNSGEEAISLSLPNGFDRNNLSYQPGNSGADNSFSQQRSVDREHYGQLDGEWTVDGGWLSALKAGVRVADHLREGSRPAKGAAPINAAKNGQVTIASLPSYGGATFPGDFGSSIGPGVIGAGAPLFDPSAVVSWSDANFSGDPVFNRPVSGVFTVQERSTAAYLMARLGGGSWRGDAGVRAVHTRTSVTTNTGVPCGAVTATNGLTYGSPLQAEQCKGFVPAGATLVTGSRFGNFYVKTTDSSGTEILPSVTLSFDLARDLQLRLAAAKVMSRPDYSALGSTISSFAWDAAATPPSTAAGGNATLKPVVARNYNIGLEWYFAKRSLLSAQAFRIDFQSLIGAGSSLQQQFNTAIPASQGGPQIVPTLVNSPMSTRGRSQGVELGFERPVWGGFGVQANYTFADAKEATGAPMLGASRHTYNLGGYYEDDVFSARLAWSHRSASRVGLYGASDNYMAAAGTLALSLGYKINDSLSLNFEGLNLNNPTARFYNVANAAVPFDATSSVFSSGRQVYLGVRAKF